MTKYYGDYNPQVDKLISEYFGGEYIGGCIDVGSNDGITASNTKHFEDRGWYCLCIEPNKNHNLWRNRKNTLDFAISNINKDNDIFNVVNYNDHEISTSSLRIDERLIELEKSIGNNNPVITQTNVNTRTLDHIIENYYKYGKIDFISIDTEGTELDVLMGLNLKKYRPKLLVVENNFNDPQIEDHLKKYDYIKDKRVEANDFYIRSEKKRIIFYNLGHKGDHHICREYIKDIIKKTNYDEYYLLSKNPYTIRDIPNLKQDFLNDYCVGEGDLTLNHQYLNINNRDIYLNITLFGDYKFHYEIMTYVYEHLDININKDISYYYPKIDYSYYEIKGVENFINKYPDQFKVLVSNGQPQSGQSSISDLNEIINKLADDFKNVLFVLTDDSKRINKPNIFNTSDIIGLKEDINEISYLSIFCDIIVGKSSGPYIYTLIEENLTNQLKTYIYVCEKIFHGIYYMDSACQKIWINIYDDDHIYRTIYEQIFEKSEITQYISLTKRDNKIFIKPLQKLDDWVTIRFYDFDHKENISVYPRYSFQALLNNDITHWVIPYDTYTNDKRMKMRIFYKNKIYMRIL